MLRVEQLEERICPKGYPGVVPLPVLPPPGPVTAVFNGSVLAVVGNRLDNTILVSADAAGNLVVTADGASVPIKSLSGAPTLARTALVSLKGGRGADTLLTDASLNIRDGGGVLVDAPDAFLAGGKGDDFLKVGHGGIVGGLAGVTNGVVTGRVVGNAIFQGGQGDDVLVSGFGNDVLFGGQGDDSYLWPPGTLTDVFSGGKGLDTATVQGNDNAGDAFVLSASDSDSLFQRVNLVQFSVLGRSVERWVLLPGSGDDSMVLNPLAGTGVKTVSADGGAGNDTLALNNPGVEVLQVNFETVATA